MTAVPDAAVAAGDAAGSALRRAEPAGPGRRALRDVLGRYATGVTVVTPAGPARRPGRGDRQLLHVGLARPAPGAVVSRPVLTWSARLHGRRVLRRQRARGRQRDLAARFAGPGDRFQGLATLPGPHGEPLIAGAAATLCCRRSGVVPAGDHLVLLGAVEHHARTARRALLFADGAYHAGPPPARA
ncbi:flavin reductase family protein [Streptomyces bungoensis]|uniref:flavin reductase family protein n=1 Tax=Streptomyces bungoensis TaxID=285568 RepID=UPI003F55B161